MEKRRAIEGNRPMIMRIKDAARYGAAYVAVGIAGAATTPAVAPQAVAAYTHGESRTSISVSSRNVSAGQEFAVRAEGSGRITLYEERFGAYMPAGPVQVGAAAGGRIEYSSKAAYMDVVVDGGLGGAGAQGYLFYASTHGGKDMSRSVRVLVRK